MNKDRTEQYMCDLYENMTVDVSKIEQKVMSKITCAAPRMINMKFVAVFAVIMILSVVTVYGANRLGAFERFFQNNRTEFVDLLRPVEHYVIDDDIKIEIIAVQRFGNDAIVYASLQDVSGRNRLQDGARTWINNALISSVVTSVAFDETSNTSYLEFHITGISPEITYLNFNEILLSPNNEFHFIPIPVDLSAIGAAETIFYPSFGMTNRTTVLKPHVKNYFPPLIIEGSNNPDHAVYSQHWISNIAIINNRLHVQTGTYLNATESSGVSFLSLQLMGQGEGVRLSPDIIRFQTNAELETIFVNMNDRTEAFVPYYTFTEWIFVLENEHTAYSLVMHDSISQLIFGEWEISVDLDTGINQIKMIELEREQSTLIRRLRISPIGVFIEGVSVSMDNDINQLLGSVIYIQTSDATLTLNPSRFISLENIGGHAPGTQIYTVYQLYATSNIPIDVNDIVYMIIGDVRIVVNE